MLRIRDRGTSGFVEVSVLMIHVGIGRRGGQDDSSKATLLFTEGGAQFPIPSPMPYVTPPFPRFCFLFFLFPGGE